MLLTFNNVMKDDIFLDKINKLIYLTVKGKYMWLIMI